MIETDRECLLQILWARRQPDLLECGLPLEYSMETPIILRNVYVWSLNPCTSSGSPLQEFRPISFFMRLSENGIAVGGIQ